MTFTSAKPIYTYSFLTTHEGYLITNKSLKADWLMYCTRFHVCVKYQISFLLMLWKLPHCGDGLRTSRAEVI